MPFVRLRASHFVCAVLRAPAPHGALRQAEAAAQLQAPPREGAGPRRALQGAPQSRATLCWAPADLSSAPARTCPCAHVPLRPASAHCARGRGLATHSARLRPQDAHSRPLTRPQPFKLRTNNWAGEDGEEPAADGTQSQRVAVPPAGAFASLPPRPRALCPAHRLYRRGRCKPAAAARAGHHSSSGAGGIGGSSRGCAGAAHRGARADAPHAAAVQAAERQPPPRGAGPHRPLTATLKRSRRRRARSTGSPVGH